MNLPDSVFDTRWLVSPVLSAILLIGCAQPPGACPPIAYADLSGAAAFAEDGQIPFRFPLDDARSDASPFYTHFCSSSDGSGDARRYHAAEDFFRPAGTPVYAMADGEIRFSGPMRGYGWLIIIDHPRINLYSLYGHLSPSRWRIRSGTVKKGVLIAYLGDSDENGGSPEHPLEPHLHLGVRAGRKADYPAMGEWRWQAGWMSPCPRDLGWLQPSAVISRQEIPPGGYAKPPSDFLAKWGIEAMFASVYLCGAICMFIIGFRRDKLSILLAAGGLLIAGGSYFYYKGTVMSYALFAMVVALSAIGLFIFIRRSAKGRDAPRRRLPAG